ncbi:MAG TPA: DUF3667 domain-containing protein [Rhizomicrobium sp.]|nr:DUF3667 domain-containing protein [Rhizomicrobium sp.]
MDGLEAISETAGAAAVEIAVAALVERGGKVHPCTNCAAPLIGPYCAACGQPIETHRRSVFVLLHDFVKDVASFDSRILRTALALLFEPGELPLAFREGRTQRYVPAVRLYLFVSLAFFVILGATHIAIVQFVPEARPEKVVTIDGQRYLVTPGDTDPDDKTKMPKWLDPAKPHYAISVNNMIFFAREGAYHSNVPDAAVRDIEDRIAHETGTAKNAKAKTFKATIRRTVEGLAKDPASLNGALTAWIPRALFFLLPAFALLVAVFYWRQRKKFYFVDHLVFSLSFHTFAFAFLLIAAGLAQVLSGYVVATITAIVLSLYLLLAMKRFYGQGWFWTSTKWFVIEFFYATSFIFPALITILVLAVFDGQ